MRKVIAVLVAIALSVTSTSASAVSDLVKAAGIMVIMGTSAHFLSKALSSPKAEEPQQAATQPQATPAPVVQQQQEQQVQEVIQLTTPAPQQSVAQQPPPPEGCNNLSFEGGAWKCYDEEIARRNKEQVADCETKVEVINPQTGASEWRCLADQRQAGNLM